MNVGCATVFKRERERESEGRRRGGREGGKKKKKKEKEDGGRDFSRVSYSGGHQWLAMTDRKEKAISSQGRARRKASLRSPFRIHVAIICRIYLCCALG